MRTACYVVKIGGSVTTNKNGRYELRSEAIQTIAKVLRNRAFAVDLPIILIFGGGSFGNLAPVEHQIVDRSDGFAPTNLPMMTLTMFSMLTDITKVLIENAVPAYPFQSSALIVGGADGLLEVSTKSIAAAISLGYVPIISGDLIFAGREGFMIFSSDNIASLLARDFDIQRVLYYTDVRGLYDSLSPTAIIPFVDGANSSAVKSYAGASSSQDITGGMLNKFVQLRALAKLGIESEVLSFEYFGKLDLSLRKALHCGTVFLAE